MTTEHNPGKWTLALLIGNGAVFFIPFAALLALTGDVTAAGILSIVVFAVTMFTPKLARWKLRLNSRIYRVLDKEWDRET